jgi:hypothetical protein
MKSGFKNVLKDKDVKKNKNPWNFDAPSYDERTSCFVNAGSHYGVGHKQPVGHEGNPKGEVIPRGKVNTMRIDEVPHRNETLDLNT